MIERFRKAPKNLIVNGEKVTQHSLDELFPQTVEKPEEIKPKDQPKIIPFKAPANIPVKTIASIPEKNEASEKEDSAWKQIGYR